MVYTHCELTKHNHFNYFILKIDLFLPGKNEKLLDRGPAVNWSYRDQVDTDIPRFLCVINTATQPLPFHFYRNPSSSIFNVITYTTISLTSEYQCAYADGLFTDVKLFYFIIRGKICRHEGRADLATGKQSAILATHFKVVLISLFQSLPTKTTQKYTIDKLIQNASIICACATNF